MCTGNLFRDFFYGTIVFALCIDDVFQNTQIRIQTIFNIYKDIIIWYNIKYIIKQKYKNGLTLKLLQ